MAEARRGRTWLEILGERVRQHRGALGWRQVDLAARIHRHETYIGAIEQGKTNLSVQVLLELSFALGVDPSAMVSGLSPLPPETGPLAEGP